MHQIGLDHFDIKGLELGPDPLIVVSDSRVSRGHQLVHAGAVAPLRLAQA